MGWTRDICYFTKLLTPKMCDRLTASRVIWLVQIRLWDCLFRIFSLQSTRCCCFED